VSATARGGSEWILKGVVVEKMFREREREREGEK
jgi:hypothetical protein